MNKQEAIKTIEQDKIQVGRFTEITREVNAIRRKIEMIDCVPLEIVVSAITKINEPEKVVIPKFVAEWLKSQKESFSDVSAIDMYDNLTIDNNGGHYHEVWLWVIAHHHDFIKAWHDGYEVEQEKLYTVEIPNPNSKGNHKIYLCKDDTTGKVYLCKGNFNPKKNKNLKLTEAEIRKDFEWAWQWAKEVL